MQIHNEDGTYKRTRTPFSLTNFNDGYADSNGRFRVYSPNHPRAYNNGYIRRTIIAYGAYHNVLVPESMNIHHIDNNRLNDSRENLELISHSEHSKLHNKSRILDIVGFCKNCGREFHTKPWRLREPSHTGKFCSSKCSLELWKKNLKNRKEVV